MTTAVNWKKNYSDELERNYYEYCKRNDEAPVKTRQLTKAEYHLIFNVDFNNIKYIDF